MPLFFRSGLLFGIRFRWEEVSGFGSDVEVEENMK